jgi:hypothetical protein
MGVNDGLPKFPCDFEASIAIWLPYQFWVVGGPAGRDKQTWVGDVADLEDVLDHADEVCIRFSFVPDQWQPGSNSSQRLTAIN